MFESRNFHIELIRGGRPTETLNRFNLLDLVGDGLSDSESAVTLCSSFELSTEEIRLAGKLPALRDAIRSINEKFADSPGKLRDLYSQITRLERAASLSPNEILSIQAGIVRDIAYPEEIRQRKTNNCGAAAFQKELAITTPVRLAEIFAEACCTGAIKLADGTTLEVDLENARKTDASKRALHTRIFHYVANNAAVQSQLEFRNSPDGIGLLFCAPFNEKSGGTAFDGLGMQHFADMSHRLTGEKKGVVSVTNLEQLRTVFRLNRERPMQILVNSEMKPFGEKSVDLVAGPADVNQHVVVILGITDGASPKIRLQNSAGKNEMTVDADVLIENAMLPRSLGLNGKFEGPICMKVISAAKEQGFGYVIKDGRLVADPEFTRILADLKPLQITRKSR